MFTLTREEVVKLAEISKIAISEEEIAPLIAQLQAVLGYAQCVQEFSEDVNIPEDKNINVFREDVAVETDPKPILEQAPDGQDGYFVVPAILENN